MSSWLAASLALLPALGAAVILCARGGLAQRLVAAQLAGSIAMWMLVALTFALDQPASIDLALMLGLLTLVWSLLAALFVERWL